MTQLGCPMPIHPPITPIMCLHTNTSPLCLEEIVYLPDELHGRDLKRRLNGPVIGTWASVLHRRR